MMKLVNADEIIEKAKSSKYFVVSLADIQDLIDLISECKIVPDKVGQWISVNSNFPELRNKKNDELDINIEESASVLVFCASGKITVANYVSFGKRSYWCGHNMFGEKVTHWMPLPEPPQK